MTDTIQYRFLVRGGTAAALAARNEVPLARELIIETDTRLMKLGDGVTAYNALPFFSGTIPGQMGFGVTNPAGPIEAGVKRIIRVMHNTVIHDWSLGSDISGSASIELWASSTYPPVAGDKITASAPPALSSQLSATGGVTGWTALIPAGSWLAFNVVAGANVSRLDLTLHTTRIP